MATPRPSFFSGPALTVMALLLSLALYVLYPRQAMFEDTNNLDNPDALSLAYLEVLLRSDPDNTSLRLNLARMQASVGQHQKAQRTLEPLLAADVVPSSAKELQLRLMMQELAATQDSQKREVLRARLAQEVRDLTEQPYTLKRKLTLLAHTQPLLTPEQLSQALGPLLSQASGTRRLSIARRLAEAQEASGSPQAAADTLRGVIELATNSAGGKADSAAFFDQLIRLELASNRPASALQHFSRHRMDISDPDSLRRGTQLAALAGADAARLRWLKQLATLEPNNLAIQRELLTQQLGAGDLRGALATAGRMQRLPAEQLSLEDRRQIAQVLQWNDKASEALAAWVALYRDQSSREALERATDLARGLFRWQTLEDLLGLAAARKQLDDSGYVLLADSRIRLGTLDAALVPLQQGRQRFPESEMLRERLLEFYLNGRRYPEAIALLQSRPTLSERERLQLANLYWRTRNPEAALTTLDRAFSDPDLADEAAEMRLNLAILLGRDEQLRTEYERLLQLPSDTLTPVTRERLLSLAVAFQDLPRALEISQQQFVTTGNPRYLAATAEYQLGLEQWLALAATLRQWQSQFPDADTNPRFWTLQALVKQQQQRPEEANTAFRRAWHLAPDNTDVISSWAWFLISQPGRLPGQLPSLLAQLGQTNQEEHYPVLAYGHNALGDPRRALNWFRKGTEAGQDSPEWLNSYAALLDDTGAGAAAFRLRQNLEARQGRPATARRRPDPDPQAGSIQPPLYQFRNRAVQLGMNWVSLGRFSVRESYFTAQSTHDNLRWRAKMVRPRASGRGLLRAEPQPSAGALLELQNNASNLLWTATLGRNDRLGNNDFQASLELTTQPGDQWTLTTGHTKGGRALDSAEAWWLVARNSTYAEARYTPFSRLDLTMDVAHLTFTGPEHNTLGSGFNIAAVANYSVFRNDPAWTLSLAYQNQQLGNLSALDGTSAGALSASTETGDILSRQFERIGLYNRWTHGEPHALFRTTPSPKWFFGLGAGYVLSTSTPDLGADIGLGWRLTGDDELAVSAGWTSEGLSGDGRFNLNVTYTLYLGEQ